MENVTIYTDGACSGNPGPGGCIKKIKKKYLEEIQIQQIT